MSFLRERISPEQIIQRNWSHKIQVFKIAAKAEKDKTLEDEKQSQQVCWFLSVFLQFQVIDICSYNYILRST